MQRSTLRAPASVLAITLVAALAIGCGDDASSDAASTPPSPAPSVGVAASPDPSADVGAGATDGSGTDADGAGGDSGPGATDAAGDASGGAADDGSDMAHAQALEGAFVQVVERVGPSVVLIETPSGLGSGVVFDDGGHIVTNAHVVGDATEFRVTTSTGDRGQTTLVGTFPPNDLAVIRVDDIELTPARFGSSAELEVGDIVMAIGNPLGLQSSVTEGIVSALGRTVTEPSGAALPDSIQTSAAINPGNSGGALVDLDGEVIGIPTLGLIDPNSGGTAAGIGFAIPSDTVTDLAGQIIDNGEVVQSRRAWLGIRAAELRQAQGRRMAPPGLSRSRSASCPASAKRR
jgi:putative serine protease PepD